MTTSPSHADEISSGAPLRSVSAAAHQFAVIMRWLALARPATLSLAVAPSLIGLAAVWAHGYKLSPLPAITLVVALPLIAAGANMLDEYVEYERQATSSWMSEQGGSYSTSNLVAPSSLPPSAILRVSLALFVVGALVSIPVVIAGGWLVLLLGLFGLAAAFFYSATNYALKRLPVGELCILLALGPGVVFVAALSQGTPVTSDEALIGFAVSIFALALVEMAHLRDLVADKRAGRRTLASMLTLRGARTLFALALLTPYLLIALAAIPHGGVYGALMAFFALPATMLPLTGGLQAQSGTAQQLVVRQTLRTYITFTCWLIIGLILTGLVIRIAPEFIKLFS